ncbi:MAG: MarC family protein [Endomicrobiales bacterium]|nr:MarC family protein [Endomicrobiales bacterium]
MFIKNILLAFIPLFVAVDAIGVLPIFVSFTQDLEKNEKSKVIIQSMTTALCVAVGFIILGKSILRFLGITTGDFMIGGGAVLFCIAIIDIISSDKIRRRPSKELGAVPLGTPLIVGPAVLTTSLILIPEYGFYATLISVFINILLAGIIFYFSNILRKLLGDTGSKSLSKVMALLLAAIAVMMIRKGITNIISGIEM